MSNCLPNEYETFYSINIFLLLDPCFDENAQWKTCINHTLALSEMLGKWMSWWSGDMHDIQDMAAMVPNFNGDEMGMMWGNGDMRPHMDIENLDMDMAWDYLMHGPCMLVGCCISVKVY